MKIAPFIRAIEDYNNNSNNISSPPNPSLSPARPPSSPLHLSIPPSLHHILVHTGQHYDDKMSRSFFQALDIPKADINLGVGSGTHAQQVGQTMMEFEKVLQQERPDWVVVVGDVNATLACSVTAKKEWVKCCHIEAGLRSGDMTMPEEINRLVTDRLSDLLLTPDELSSENLRKEGVSEERIRFVGNIMIDTLEAQRGKAEALDINEIILNNSLDHQQITDNRQLITDGYAVITMHRPSNVDDPVILGALIDFLCDEVCRDMPLIWPIHPRTENNLKNFGLWEQVVQTDNMILLYPVGYHEMLRLNMGARIMLTDSGGLQEECCVLGTPCLTLRWNTERPVTLKEHGGASVLVGNAIENIRQAYHQTLKEERRPVRPKLWDGQTAKRCLVAILEYEKS
ncbi:UDP-N-acetylglucosamine 2-epimerase (non-hydrolyzing) [Desulfonatronospira sp.]|uniref:non-hydrolyzing UDP-N-acetylglucosamine 2-epimerase n=1 Tax=Desulfonatronospira sp. TaxID=1962951 RepID=UPI0025BF8E07|nr:UDP-N-acetylglucosamine 2-epimerase (non-hydrolyzing) [Desulfonatronospira sp.]